jgi:cytochrome c-type biogenesis protein CcmH/NrfF
VVDHSLSPGAHFLLWGIPLLLVVFAIAVHVATGRRKGP